MSTEQAPVLSARGLSKTFGGRTVLQNVDLDILRGEIHGLVGQNGSGKSTLIKILAGYYAPDPGGTLTVKGVPLDLPLDPHESDRLGLSFVHQDLGLAPELTVLENLRVRHYSTAFGWRIVWGKERSIVRSALDVFDLKHIDPNSLVNSLREVDRAMIAIVRAFMRLEHQQGGVLVLDEPTVYLPLDGTERLFDAIKTISLSGYGVIFVTHRLEEVRSITDRITVLRDGLRVDTKPTRELSERALLERILGRELGELYPSAHQVEGEPSLRIASLRGPGVRGFDLDMLRGEVVGVTGLLGMGQERIPYLAFGAERADGGSVEVAGRRYELRNFSPRNAIKAGIALLPADRLRNGAAQVATVRENVTLSTLHTYFHGGVLHHRAERRRVDQLLGNFNVSPADPDRVFGELSGGNQQKALIAKWFETGPKVLLLHEPTQGVDIGARKQIFSRIRDFAEAGGSVLISSVEYEDLAHLCDRVIVFRNGSPVAQIRKEDLTEATIVEHCYRTESSAA